MSTVTTHLRPLALSLALGLSAAGFASTAFAGQQTTWYDKWPEIQAQMQTQASQQQAFATQAAAPTTDASGASLAAPQDGTAAVNGLGEHVDRSGIPVLEDRGMED